MRASSAVVRAATAPLTAFSTAPAEAQPDRAKRLAPPMRRWRLCIQVSQPLLFRTAFGALASYVAKIGFSPKYWTMKPCEAKGRCMAIGVFVSGVGSQTFHRELTSGFPTRDFIYLGDQAHAPYGGRGSEDIV